MYSGGRDGYDSRDLVDLEEDKAELTSSAESVEDWLFVHNQYSSAPSSPEGIAKQHSSLQFPSLSVKERVSSLENLSLIKPVHSIKMGLKEELGSLKQSRGGYKGRITQILNVLKTWKDAGTLNGMLLARLEKTSAPVSRPYQ